MMTLRAKEEFIKGMDEACHKLPKDQTFIVQVETHEQKRLLKNRYPNVKIKCGRETL